MDRYLVPLMQSEQASAIDERRHNESSSEGACTETAPVASLPELLAPAGNWECAKAAVENGADAIYFGLEKFNARMRAHNFTEADLPRLMEFLHRRGLKGYVTFNTLIFENEMAQAEESLRAIIAAGVDAAIVQDVGICRLIRQLSPDFPIHASTQMTITSAGGVEFARELGCNLVVLARECSIKEIEKIWMSDEWRTTSDRKPESPQAALPPVTRHASLPLEVFVHGALCVAYSGQCLTSEALGGRSANRGECAQACRMPYDLIADGKEVPLEGRKYLLSPQDLAGLEVLPELARAGVASLKIEGRLKSPEYVANITQIYRKALDSLAKGRVSGVEGNAPVLASAHHPSSLSPRPFRYDMEMAFSRGLYTGWLRGINNQALVHGRFGKKRGVYLGKVIGLQGESVVINLQAPLKPGDGVVFDGGQPEEKEEGGRVYEIKAPHPNPLPIRWGEGENAPSRVNTSVALRSDTCWKPVLLSFGRGDINSDRVHVGDKVWKTSDPKLERRLRQTFEGDRPRFQRPLWMEVHGREGQPLALICRDELGHVVRLDSSMPLAKAEQRPLDAGRLRAQLGRLGGTAFRLGELLNFLEGEVLLSMSELNRLRRDAVHELEALRARPKRWTLLPATFERVEGRGSRAEGASRGSPHLIVLVRNLPQLEAALRCGVETLYCEFEDPKKYREAVQMVHAARAAGPNSQLSTLNPQLFVAPPRIFKTGEEWTLKQVRSCDADGYLVRNYDHLNFFARERRIGDFSLNVANRLSAEYFKNQFGLERVTASYDLNFIQLEALLQRSPPGWFEITIHQHMPMFYMEHCVFCAFLSTGTDYTNCGRPCDRHDLKLRDRVGAEHPIKADVGCRNAVFNALAQTGAEHVSRMLALGARHFRIEFLSENPEQVAGTIGKYRQLLRGEIAGAQLWRELKLLSQLGVTRGPVRG
jgi:putative protease